MQIFYSWQSDLSANNDFIYECLQEAVSVLNTSNLIERAERDDSDLSEDSETEEVILDKDTEGVTGSPEIINTILEKISKCDVYVADITFVGTRQKNGRMLSNPNVLIELGYALGKLGRPKVLLVFDEASGKKSKLPFDLKTTRFPICFSSNDFSGSKAAFVESLVQALKPFHEQLKIEAKPKLLLSWKVTQDSSTNIKILLQNIGDTRFVDYSVKAIVPTNLLRPGVTYLHAPETDGGNTIFTWTNLDEGRTVKPFLPGAPPQVVGGLEIRGAGQIELQAWADNSTTTKTFIPLKDLAKK